MNLTAEQIINNWNNLLKIIEENIEESRCSKLIDLYKSYEERLSTMPASHKKEYHGAFPGGYIYHVLGVTNNALLLYDLWEKAGADMSTFTKEELVFSAVNHDLGKMGTIDEESYIPQTDQWRKDKLGENYTFNSAVPFASVPDRGLYILQSYGIQYSFNEMVAIQTHDGLYDEGNKKYLQGFLPEQKPRTCLPYILHQADLMASRIEFENEWLPKFKKKEEKPDILPKPENKKPIKQKALENVKSNNLVNLLNNI